MKQPIDFPSLSASFLRRPKAVIRLIDLDAPVTALPEDSGISRDSYRNSQFFL